MPRSQKRAVNPLKLQLQLSVRQLIWEPESGPLEEQQVSVIEESSVQHQTSNLITSYMQTSKLDCSMVGSEKRKPENKLFIILIQEACWDGAVIRN